MREPQHLGANADSAFVQSLDRDFVTFAGLSENVRFWNAHVLHDEFARAGGANAELVFFLAHGESGRFLLDNECGDAAVAGRRIDVREQDEDAGFLGIGDPKLAAINNVLVPAQFGARLHGKGVGTRTSLAQGICAHGIGCHAR